MNHRKLVARRSTLWSAALLVAALALVAGCQRAGTGSGARASISGKELESEIKAGKAPIILDVRTPEEFKSGHIPGARNVPLDELQSRLPELGIAKSDEVVVHCERGGRAAKAEEMLAASGYQKVVDLDGHMNGWRAAGLPVE
jgi:phage shock protein E